MPGVSLLLEEQRWLPVIIEIASAAGTASMQTESLASDRKWIVDMITLGVLNGSGFGATCSLYHTDPTPMTFIALSSNATQDVFEGTLEVPGGECLDLEWAGVTPGALCSARIHYSQYQVIAAGTDNSISTWRKR